MFRALDDLASIESTALLPESQRSGCHNHIFDAQFQILKKKGHLTKNVLTILHVCQGLNENSLENSLLKLESFYGAVLPHLLIPLSIEDDIDATNSCMIL